MILVSFTLSKFMKIYVFESWLSMLTDSNLNLFFFLAGQEDYSAVRDQYMRTGDGFLIVYAINLRSSFDEVSSFHNHVLRVKDLDTIPLVLCGNKADLGKERQVQKAEGDRLAETLHCEFYETSAKMNHNVKESFFALVRRVKLWKDQNITKPEVVAVTTASKRRCILI
eukprot:TRINITY_DN1946_c0_g1_i1.p1 TRINITY_DN1946_c0_g1~~TRINITY_DN1946_c0_g1_i1.p1  ORF type:complete len:169 (+),score=6.75 TRINITY_DN1946_c0_g1_i1:184-690(+)